jgi:hypothetical protein
MRQAFAAVAKPDKGAEANPDEHRMTFGDWLSRLLLGARQAPCDDDRESVMLTVTPVSPPAVEMLIALFGEQSGCMHFSLTLVQTNRRGCSQAKRPQRRFFKMI